MKRSLFVAIVSALFLISSVALAEEDEHCDCSEDTICQVESYMVCATEPWPCEFDEDEEEFDCLPIDEGPIEECYEETFVWCAPKECESDADCSEDNVCVEYVYESCSMPGCADPGDECDAEATCDVETYQYCVPPYLAPCQEDSDCGEGFTCEARDYGCADISPDGGFNDGDDLDEEWSGCDEPDDDAPKYCSLIYVPCESDLDCDGGFECFQEDRYVCVDGDGDAPDSGEGWDGDDSDDMGDSAMPCVGEGDSYCAPPNYYYGGGGYDYGGGVMEDAELISSERVDDDGSAPDSSGQTSSGGRRASACAAVPGQAPPLGFVLVGLVMGLVALRRR
jgi:hypothetical protein